MYFSEINYLLSLNRYIISYNCHIIRNTKTTLYPFYIYVYLVFGTLIVQLLTYLIIKI